MSDEGGRNGWGVSFKGLNPGETPWMFVTVPLTGGIPTAKLLLEAIVSVLFENNEGLEAELEQWRSTNKDSK